MNYYLFKCRFQQYVYIYIYIYKNYYFSLFSLKQSKGCFYGSRFWLTIITLFRNHILNNLFPADER